MRLPIKYRIIIARDKQRCVIGSVDGVTIAPIIVDPTITYFHKPNICSLEIKFVKPNTNCRSGIWKVIPVVKNNSVMKLRYSSKDHKGSTKSELYVMKKVNAAGIKIL